MVSEYGAISKPHDAYEPFFGDLQTEPFPWRSGEAIWAAFDYGSIAGRLAGIERDNDVLIDGEDGRRHRVPFGIITRANLEVEF